MTHTRKAQAKQQQQQQAAAWVRGDFEVAASEAEAATRALRNVTAYELAGAVLRGASNNSDRNVSSRCEELPELSDVYGDNDQKFGHGQLVVSP